MSKNFTNSRNCCFTLNNPTDAETKLIESFKTTKPAGLIRLITQLETGDNGTPHYQGYAEFDKPLSKSAMKKILGSERFHLEKRLGTIDQAVNYCKKPTTRLQDPIIIGDFSDTKTKTVKKLTLDDVYAQFLAGKRLYDIQQQSPGYYFKNKKVIFEMYNAVKQANNKYKARVVVVITGQTGVGKTRYFHETYPSQDHYVLTKASANNNLWLDNYTDQKYVCIDEFYGWIPLNTLLGMLHGYACQLECKGGFVWFDPDIVYITSNTHPSKWYGWSDLPDGELKRQALMRRITHCIEVPNDIPYDIFKKKMDVYLKQPTIHKRLLYEPVKDAMDIVTETVTDVVIGDTEKKADLTFEQSLQPQMFDYEHDTRW